MTITSIDQQLGEQPVKPSVTVPHFEANDNALPDQSKVLGFEFATEPVEVSPETEITNSNEADMAAARLAIGQQLDIIWLKGYDFGVKKLEQENAELKAQLATKNELLSNTEQLPVYDADWLSNTVNNYDDIYLLIGVNINVGGITMSANNSAHIILRAVAKELNGDWDGKGQFEVIVSTPKDYEVRVHQTSTTYHGGVKFAPYFAQKAISILNQIDPQILKNYFA